MNRTVGHSRGDSMTNLIDQFVKILLFKADLVRREAELWERGAQILNTREESARADREEATQAKDQIAQIDTRPSYLSVKDAARYIGVSRSLLYRLRASGEGPELVKLGNRVLYPRHQLDRYMQRRRLPHKTR